MPTYPFDQSWPASQAMTSARSRCSDAGYSSVARPSEEPVPRRSTRTRNRPSVRSRSYAWPYGRGQVVLAVGERLEQGGERAITGGQVEVGGQVRPVRHRDPAGGRHQLVSGWARRVRDRGAARRAARRASPRAWPRGRPAAPPPPPTRRASGRRTRTSGRRGRGRRTRRPATGC